MTPSRGRLVVLEGPEGAGKSTQLRRLAARLEAAGIGCLALREPGGTPLGDEVRRVLLHDERDMTPAAEALLFMASRAELVTRVIRPALQAGTVVLLDRFFLSTYAYQVAGRGLDEAAVRQANALATGGLVPDLTILLRIAAPAGLARAAGRGSADRIERSGDAFHDRVVAAFDRFASAKWQASHPEAGPIIEVDASGREDAIERRLAEELAGRWPETFPLPVESE